MDAKVHVDKDISTFLPDLTKDERARLRKSILEDGCTDPVVYWKETGAVVDGSNRVDICDHEGLGYKTFARSFKNVQEVKRWILQRQGGRRNISDVALVDLIQQVEQEELSLAAAAREKAGKQGVNPGANWPQGRTNEQIANLAGVSETTVKRVNTIKTNGIPVVVDAAKAGDISTHKASEIAKLPKQKQAKALKAAKEPKVEHLTDDSGVEVPDNLRAVFRLVPLFDTVIKQYVPGIQTNMRRIAETIKEYRANSADVVAKNLNTIFSAMRPAYVCKPCGGVGCDSCKNRGWKAKPCK